MQGWDFSWLGSRLSASPPPWSYRTMVHRLALVSGDLLDLGTGGGEWLADLDHRPHRTVATEGWPPNVAVARARLGPLGVEVLGYQSPSENVTQAEVEPGLPFPDGTFHLIANRHESFVAKEVARVLAQGGHFITQQVGGGERLAALLGITPPQPRARPWDMAPATVQLEAAGLRITDGSEIDQVETVADLGALVWYLRAAPWEVPSFSLESFRSRLLELHVQSQSAPLQFARRAFWLLAQA